MKRIFAIVFAFALFTQVSQATTCEEHLATFIGKEDGVIVYGPTQAAARSYPLDFTLENIRIPKGALPQLGPNVVLLGEGYGTLFAAFNEIPGVDVRAVDPIYGMNPIPPGHMGDHLREFLKEHGHTGKLITASSDQVPLEDGWADSVIGHLLLNNFANLNNTWQPVAYKSIVEALRLVKPGGRVIFASFLEPVGHVQLLTLAAKAMKAKPGQIAYDVRGEDKAIRYDDFGKYSLDKAGVVTEMPFSTITIIKKF